MKTTSRQVSKDLSVEEKLLESEARLRLATEGTQLATWDLDLKTREIVYSKRLATIFGHPETKKFTHQEMRDQIHPDDREAVVEAAFRQAMKTGEYSYEARVVHPDKSIHWIRTLGKVNFGNDGVPLRMLGTMMDITEFRVGNELVEKLAAIVQSSDDAIISKTLDGIITSWNAAAERIFGYTSDEMVGQPMFKIIPPDRLNEETEILSKLRKGERVDHFETIRVAKSGKQLNVSLMISPIKGPNGRVVGASKIARDITLQKESERRIAESEEKFRLLANSMPQFVWTSDERGNLHYFNEAMMSFTGLNHQELGNGGWIQTIHPEERKATSVLWAQSIQTGEPFLMEHRFKNAAGQYRWLMSRAETQKDKEGKIQMWVGTSTDIHDRKIFTDDLETKVALRTKELNQRNEDLVKSNIELGQFAYVASHDLQEPLRKILTFSTRIQDLEGDKLSTTAKDYFARLQSASLRMKQLIVDLLAYSRASTAERYVEPVDLNTLLKNILEQLKETIDQKQAIVECDPLPVILAIPFQIEQLFTNLLSNALKFSQLGRVPKVQVAYKVVDNVTVEDIARTGPFHCIAFIDNGIGFDPQFSERIFQVFQRLHGKDEYTGTGIGLSIVRKIVENHKGFVETESQPDKGATFTVYLPKERV